MRAPPKASTILGPPRSPPDAASCAVAPRVHALVSSIVVCRSTVATDRTPPRAAGPPPQPDAAQIALGLRKLGVVGSVLYVAAHPDDENTALLAYLANGALRAHRLPVDHARRRRPEPDRLRAGAGARAHPHRRSCWPRAASTAPSSSSPARATSATRRAPRRRCASGARTRCSPTWCAVIRRFRPDVIVTRFSPEPADTHGHHTASAMLARRGVPRRRRSARFTPSSSPAASTPWQARRIFWNRSSWSDQAGRRPGRRSSSSTSAATTRCSARRTARSPPTAAACTRARASAWRASRAPIVEYFQVARRRADGAPAQAPASTARRHRPHAGSRFPGGARSSTRSSRARSRSFDPADARRRRSRRWPRSTPRSTRVPDAGWRAQKQRELQRADARVRGRCSPRRPPPDYRVAPGADVEVTATARRPLAGGRHAGGRCASRSAARRSRSASALAPQAPPAPRRRSRRSARCACRPTLPPSTPYWLDAAARRRASTHVADAALIGPPESPPPLAVDFTLRGRAAARFTVRRAGRLQVDRSGDGRALPRRSRSRPPSRCARTRRRC